MRSATLALLAFGLTSVLPTGAAAAELFTIRTTGTVHGTDGMGLFGQGSTIVPQAFEVKYFFTRESGTRQNFSFYNGSPSRPPGADAVIQLITAQPAVGVGAIVMQRRFCLRLRKVLVPLVPMHRVCPVDPCDNGINFKHLRRVSTEQEGPLRRAAGVWEPQTVPVKLPKRAGCAPPPRFSCLL